MQSFVQIVFLLDISALHTRKTLVSKVKYDCAQQSIRLACLRILCYFLNRFNTVRWGYKFFCSRGSTAQYMERFPFNELNLEFFENFESELSRRYDGYRSAFEAETYEDRDFNLSSTTANSQLNSVRKRSFKENVKTKSDHLNCPCYLLKRALTEMLCDYQWDTPNISSPVRKQDTSEKYQTEFFEDRKNFVFLISSCPQSRQDLSDFFGGNLPLPKDLLESIMPISLRKKFCTSSKLTLRWLDTSLLALTDVNEMNTVLESPNLIDETLRQIKGSVIPLHALVQTTFSAQRITELFLFGYSNKDSPCDRSNDKNNENKIVTELLVPFSSLAKFYLFSQDHIFVSQKGYLAELVFQDFAILICILSILQERVPEMSDGFGESMNEHCSSHLIRELKQREKFHPLGTLPSEAVGLLNPEIYICIAESCNKESVIIFNQLLRELATQGLSLIIRSEMNVEQVTLCVLTSLTTSSFSMQVFNPLLFWALPKQLSLVEYEKKINKNMENSFATEFINEVNSHSEGSAKSCGSVKVKPFQIHIIENWFSPLLLLDELVQNVQEISEHNEEAATVFNKLKQHYKPNQNIFDKKNNRKGKLSSDSAVVISKRRSPRLRKCRSSTLNISHRAAQLVERSFITKSKSTAIQTKRDVKPDVDIPLIAYAATLENDSTSFSSEAKLIEHLNQLYNESLKSRNSMMNAAQAITNTILCFVKSLPHVDNIENYTRQLMEKNFLLSSAKISEKYKDVTEFDAAKRKVAEYQLQILLIMELESIFSLNILISPKSIETLLSLLRIFSFLVGPAELHIFILENLKENYSHSLKDLLKEIGDELNVPIFSKMHSPPSIESCASSSETLHSELHMSYDSIYSGLSSASQGSHKGRRNRAFTRDLSSSFMEKSKRQIMVPHLLLEKEKTKKIKEIKTKKSTILVLPSSSSKSLKVSNKLLSVSDTKVRRVRRNLFVQDSECVLNKSPSKNSPRSVNFSRSQIKTDHIRKTKFVPETPPVKQGSQATLRKQDRLRKKTKTEIAFDEITESPMKHLLDGDSTEQVFINNKKNQFSFYPDSTINISQDFERVNTKEHELHHRRSSEPLSLKFLFSKILTSPKLGDHSSFDKDINSRFSYSSLERNQERKNKKDKVNNKHSLHGVQTNEITPFSRKQNLHLDYNISSKSNSSFLYSDISECKHESIDETENSIMNVNTVTYMSPVKTPMKADNLAAEIPNSTPQSKRKLNCKRMLKLDNDRDDDDLVEWKKATNYNTLSRKSNGNSSDGSKNRCLSKSVAHYEGKVNNKTKMLQSSQNYDFEAHSPEVKFKTFQNINSNSTKKKVPDAFQKDNSDIEKLPEQGQHQASFENSLGISSSVEQNKSLAKVTSETHSLDLSLHWPQRKRKFQEEINDGKNKRQYIIKQQSTYYQMEQNQSLCNATFKSVSNNPRFTRSKSKETGISPESFRKACYTSPSQHGTSSNKFDSIQFMQNSDECENIKIPVRKRHSVGNPKCIDFSEHDNSRDVGSGFWRTHQKDTPKQKKLYADKLFSSPSALSLLHLTTSPVILEM